MSRTESLKIRARSAAAVGDAAAGDAAAASKNARAALMKRCAEPAAGEENCAANDCHCCQGSAFKIRLDVCIATANRDAHKVSTKMLYIICNKLFYNI
jgi:hypothetical protein